jgi:ribonuclease R
VLVLQMLSKRIGEELDCVVTGLAGFGVFVQCRKFGVEGLVRLDDLGPDQWGYDAKAQCVVGARSGHSIRLGQAMKVHIVSVNVPARQLNVRPIEPVAKAPRQQGKRRAGKKQTARKRQKRR